MKGIPPLVLWMLLAGVLSFTAVTAAEPPGIRSDKPIKITSNELSSDADGKVATFIGSVVAKQDDLTVYCDRLVVHYGDKERDITRVEALGNVRVVQGNRQGVAGKATFDNRAGTIILEENPRVSQGSDTVTGKVITFYLNEQKSVVTGGADRRVEAVINPKGSGINVGTNP